MHVAKLTFTAAVLSAATLVSTAARADQVRESGNFGVGLGVSTFAAPLSGKYFLSSEHALQMNAGFFQDDFDFDGGGLGLGADYLFELPALAGNEVELAWAAGGGLALGVAESTTALAVVGVIGLELNINAVPLDIVLEYRPHLLLTPDVDFDAVEAGGHVRYYF